MSFSVTLEAIQEWLDDDMSLQTLKNQYTVQEIYDLIEDKESITTDDELYEAFLNIPSTKKELLKATDSGTIDKEVII